ncbi:hypothetical protein VTH06DRAFT_2222 [Thermothelomyces fergusii]
MTHVLDLPSSDAAAAELQSALQKPARLFSPTICSTISQNHPTSPALRSIEILQDRLLSNPRSFDATANLSINHVTSARSVKMAFTASDICKIIFAIILPPLGVFLERGCDSDLFINILLTILGYIPGIVHALYIICKY